jgi:hypothetical protein
MCEQWRTYPCAAQMLAVEEAVCRNIHTVSIPCVKTTYAVYKYRTVCTHYLLGDTS